MITPHFKMKDKLEDVLNLKISSNFYYPPQVASLYNFPISSNPGQGQLIGIIELGGGYTQAQIQTYLTEQGITNFPIITDVSIDGATNSGQGGNDSVEVSGTDAKESRRLESLRKLGVKVFVGHSPDNLLESQTVIFSTAIKESNPELQAAREKNLNILKRSDALGVLTRQFETIAVSGTHGKTTTTSMVTVALQACGEDPSFAIGSELSETGSNAHLGEGSNFIVEADESDGSFLHLAPKVAVVTNVEPDHLDYWETFERIEKAFIEFCELTKARDGFAVICADDKGGQKLIGQVKSKGVKVLSAVTKPN